MAKSGSVSLFLKWRIPDFEATPFSFPKQSFTLRFRPNFPYPLPLSSSLLLPEDAKTAAILRRV